MVDAVFVLFTDDLHFFLDIWLLRTSNISVFLTHPVSNLKTDGVLPLTEFIDPRLGDKVNLMPELTLSLSQGSMNSATRHQALFSVPFTCTSRGGNK